LLYGICGSGLIAFRAAGALCWAALSQPGRSRRRRRPGRRDRRVGLVRRSTGAGVSTRDPEQDGALASRRELGVGFVATIRRTQRPDHHLTREPAREFIAPGSSAIVAQSRSTTCTMAVLSEQTTTAQRRKERRLGPRAKRTVSRLRPRSSGRGRLVRQPSRVVHPWPLPPAFPRRHRLPTPRL
jgi:hypothetical protein